MSCLFLLVSSCVFTFRKFGFSKWRTHCFIYSSSRAYFDPDCLTCSVSWHDMDLVWNRSAEPWAGSHQLLSGFHFPFFVGTPLQPILFQTLPPLRLYILRTPLKHQPTPLLKITGPSNEHVYARACVHGGVCMCINCGF